VLLSFQSITSIRPFAMPISTMIAALPVQWVASHVKVVYTQRP
jgi:hypothetical protein